jgi:hypothetical protein
MAMLALTLLAPMAILRLARTDSVLSAANPLGVLGDIFRGGLDYLAFWGVVLATYLVLHTAMALASLLTMGLLTPVVILLAPACYVYIKLFSAQLLGQYGRVHLKA